MRIETALAGPSFSGLNCELSKRQAASFRRDPDVLPDFIRHIPEVASPRLCEPLEPSSLLSTPANFLLVQLDGSRLRDLDSPAPVLLLPQVGNDSEPDEGVMHILGEAFRGHRELDPGVAAHRVDRPVAAHQHSDELAESRTIPAPSGIWKSFCIRELAHQLELTQPLGQRVWPATGSRWVVRNLVLPHTEAWIEVSDLVVTVANQAWIGVRDAGRI